VLFRHSTLCYSNKHMKKQRSYSVSPLWLLAALLGSVGLMALLILTTPDTVTPIALRGQVQPSSSASPEKVGACYYARFPEKCEQRTASECWALRSANRTLLGGAQDTCYKSNKDCVKPVNHASSSITLGASKVQCKTGLWGSPKNNYLLNTQAYQSCWDAVQRQAKKTCEAIAFNTEASYQPVCNNGGQTHWTGPTYEPGQPDPVQVSDGYCTLYCEGFFTCLAPTPSYTPIPGFDY
jgi:hypothetical protein